MVLSEWYPQIQNLNVRLPEASLLIQVFIIYVCTTYIFHISADWDRRGSEATLVAKRRRVRSDIQY